MKEEKNSSNKIQNLMRKRWVLPSVYLAAAAGLLSTVLFLQSGEDTERELEISEGPEQTEEPTAPVDVANESFHLPVENEADFDRVGIFYDAQAEADEQEQAIVYFNNMYVENKGIDFASKDQAAFPVMASMSGNVTKAMKDSLLGFVVEVDHGDGVVTHYSSLSSMEVEQGQEISQGDVIGEAGSNSYNQEAGVHVHFEVRQDGVAVNPMDAIEKSVEDIAAFAPQGEEKEKEKEKENEKEENEKPDENQKPDENEKPEENEPSAENDLEGTTE
ncbi:M23 family metallopeptidase [Bacillus sp. Marseille-P3800]|uniref:M23 family metallopeptidase n=1 Tax=Bacillus sp. Marseille-P3800 TaxID=2014782 RepID=UPI000C089C8B|nr:M23 family metallopeptidase [Bacillus sp. Marseille-P3800]